MAEQYKLKKPVTFEEVNYEALTLDFDKLTGNDILSAETQYRVEQPDASNVLVKELTKAYQAYVVARAADVPVELVRSLSANDFTRLTVQAQSFLLGMG